MHVTAFTAASYALLENGAATAHGLPRVGYSVAPLPVDLQIPIVVSVWTKTGEDLDSRFYIRARDPDGELRGNIERMWHWPDPPGKPFKFRVFTEYLQVLVDKEGFYRIGLYDHPDQAATDVWFPVEVSVTPLAVSPGSPQPWLQNLN